MDQPYSYPWSYPSNVIPIRPAGQVTPAPITPTPGPPSDVRIGPDGRITGINGILDQIAEAAARQVGPLIQQVVPPILRNDVLPILQRDKEMQREIGMAVGTAAARELKPWIILIGVSLGVMAGVQVAKYTRSRRSHA